MKPISALLPAAIVAGMMMNTPAEAKSTRQAGAAEHHHYSSKDEATKSSRSKGEKAKRSAKRERSEKGKSKGKSAVGSRRSKTSRPKAFRHKAPNAQAVPSRTPEPDKALAVPSSKPDSAGEIARNPQRDIAPVTPPDAQNLLTLQELAQLRGLEDFATRHAPRPSVSGFDAPSEDVAHEVITSIEAMAPQYEVPTWFALRIARVESNYNPAVRGKAGEYGIFQIKCDTARMLGFTRDCGELADAKTNIEWGLIHLSHALKLANGDLELAASKHNGGLGRQHLVRRYVSLVF